MCIRVRAYACVHTRACMRTCSWMRVCVRVIPVEVRVDDPVPIVNRQLLERASRDIGAGVINQDVNAPMRADDVPNQR